MAPFLQKLWQLQRDRGLNDAELARRIGVNQSTISRMKHKERKTPGLRVALAMIREFPELAPFLTPTNLPTSQPILPSCKDAEVS